MAIKSIFSLGCSIPSADGGGGTDRDTASLQESLIVTDPTPRHRRTGNTCWSIWRRRRRCLLLSVCCVRSVGSVWCVQHAGPGDTERLAVDSRANYSTATADLRQSGHSPDITTTTTSLPPSLPHKITPRIL